MAQFWRDPRPTKSKPPRGGERAQIKVGCLYPKPGMARGFYLQETSAKPSGVEAVPSPSEQHQEGMAFRLDV